MNSEANQVDWRRRKAATFISLWHFAQGFWTLKLLQVELSGETAEA